MNDQQIAERCRDTMWENDPASRELGMTIEVPAPGRAEASFEVRADMVNGHAICHGGYIFTLADSAFAFACNSYNRVTVAAGATVEFLRPARLGERLTASAAEVHRGGRTGVYDVIVRNQDAVVVAMFRGRSYSTREAVFQSDT